MIQLSLNTLIVTSYLLASVTDFEVKHNKSTVPCTVSLTLSDFTRLTCPPNPALAVGPLNNGCFLAAGGLWVKSPAQSIRTMHHLSRNYTISTWMQPLWESHQDWKSLRDIKIK